MCLFEPGFWYFCYHHELISQNVHWPQKNNQDRNPWFGDNLTEPSLHLPYSSRIPGMWVRNKGSFIVCYWIRSAFLQNIIKNIDDSNKIGTQKGGTDTPKSLIYGIVCGASRGKSDYYRRQNLDQKTSKSDWKFSDLCYIMAKHF